MKYEIEIEDLFKKLFSEDWMSKEDYKEVIATTLKTMGKTKQEISNKIEIGVENGYTVEQQVELIGKIINNIYS